MKLIRLAKSADIIELKAQVAAASCLEDPNAIMRGKANRVRPTPQITQIIAIKNTMIVNKWIGRGLKWRFLVTIRLVRLSMMNKKKIMW